MNEPIRPNDPPQITIEITEELYKQIVQVISATGKFPEVILDNLNLHEKEGASVELIFLMNPVVLI